MNVDVQSKNLEITSALREFIHRQVSKLSDHRYPVSRVTAFIETVRRKKNDVFAAVVKLRVAVPGKEVVVQREGVNVYETVTDAANRASRALRKHKEKFSTRKQRVG